MGNIFEIFKVLEAERGGRRPQGSPSYLLVGLGNPGMKYLATRHNVGFAALDYIAGQRNAKIQRAARGALSGECELSGERVILVKPQTYMNLSGDAVGATAEFYTIPPERVIVILDDVALPPGRVRVRPQGSAGGQKGLKSILERLGTEAVPRIRVGVGAPVSAEYEMADYVLGVPSSADRQEIEAAFPRVLLAAELLCAGKIEEAMSRCNG